jgi:hypothetical protein
METFSAISLDEPDDDFPYRHRNNDHGATIHDPTVKWRRRIGARRRYAYGRRSPQRRYNTGFVGITVGAAERASNPNDDTEANISTVMHPSKTKHASDFESCTKTNKGPRVDCQTGTPFFKNNDSKKTAKRKKKNSYYLFHPVGTGPERAAKAQKAYEILKRLNKQQAHDQETASSSSSGDSNDNERPKSSQSTIVQRHPPLPNTPHPRQSPLQQQSLVTVRLPSDGRKLGIGLGFLTFFLFRQTVQS